MGDKVRENPAALRAAVFLLSAKNRRGGGVFKHPPSRAKEHLVLCFDETKMDLKPLVMLFSPILFSLLPVMICAEAIAKPNC